MLWLNTEKDRPDFGWFKNFLEERCKTGIRVHRPVEEEKEALKLSLEATAELAAAYGIVNPNSPKQVVEFMRSVDDPLVTEVCMDEKTQKISSNKDGLIILAENGRKWAMQLLKYRSSNSTLQNINSVMNCADMNMMIHPDIDMQKSNRISYLNPGLMNIRKELIWKILQPEFDGDYIWSADVKNQEPWITAHITGAKQIIDLAEKASDAGGSIYKAVYDDIFHKPIESDAAYAEMKAAWNMMTYGGTLVGLKKRCKIIDAEAVYKYFNSIKELKEYKSRTYALKSKGIQSVQTAFHSTVSTDKVGFELQRSLMDLPIQGTGADILAMLVRHIVEETARLGIDKYVRVYFTRHDEIIFEVDKEWQDSIGAEDVAATLAELTKHRVDDWVPFRVDIEQLK